MNLRLIKIDCAGLIRVDCKCYNRIMDLIRLGRVSEIECGLVKDKPLVVGVSGGPDSLCLLHLMKRLGYFVIAMHINHQLRPEANAESEIVERYCTQWQIPFMVRRVDVHAFMLEQKLSIEESARVLRYHALMETASQVSAQALAVAHQANDQVETVLMHILRGAGASGLKGMTYRAYNSDFSETIPIVRPLLEVEREEILAYCAENQITPCLDMTNSDPTFFRNRIRLELIPNLNTYNSQASRHLWLLAQLIGDENRYLEEVTQNVLQTIVDQTGEGYFLINRSRFQELDRVIQRRLVRQLLSSLKSNLRDIGFEPINQVITFLTTKSAHGEWQILEDVHLTAIGTSQVLLFTRIADFSTLWPLLKLSENLQVSFPGEFWLNDHWKIDMDLCRPDQVDIKNEANWAYFDADKLTQPLTLGLRQRGERFVPFGKLKQSVKIGDFFTNLHHPELARNLWPILRMDEHVLWIVGLRRSMLAAVDRNTKQILRIHLVNCK